VHCQKAEWQSGSLKVHITAAATTDGSDCAALRNQLGNENMGPIRKEVFARRCPEWKNNADCSLIYKSYWVQWNSLVECNWELADGCFKTAQIALPWSRVKEYWNSFIQDFQQEILVSAKPWARLGSSTGYKQLATLTGGANNVIPMLDKAPEPGARA
jgi:hypothetical protein